MFGPPYDLTPVELGRHQKSRLARRRLKGGGAANRRREPSTGPHRVDRYFTTMEGDAEHGPIIWIEGSLN